MLLIRPGRLRTKKPHDKMEEPVFLIVEACSLNQHIIHKFRLPSPVVDAVKMNRFHQPKKKNCVKETNEKTVVDYFRGK